MQKTAPTAPAQTAATSCWNPLRSTNPDPERPRSSSITAARWKPNWRACCSSAYCRRVRCGGAEQSAQLQQRIGGDQRGTQHERGTSGAEHPRRQPTRSAALHPDEDAFAAGNGVRGIRGGRVGDFFWSSPLATWRAAGPARDRRGYDCGRISGLICTGSGGPDGGVSARIAAGRRGRPARSRGTAPQVGIH